MCFCVYYLPPLVTTVAIVTQLCCPRVILTQISRSLGAQSKHDLMSARPQLHQCTSYRTRTDCANMALAPLSMTLFDTSSFKRESSTVPKNIAIGWVGVFSMDVLDDSAPSKSGKTPL